jgi:hypothetical protein
VELLQELYTKLIGIADLFLDVTVIPVLFRNLDMEALER